MCGRFTLASPDEVVAEVFGLSSIPALRPRFNIAPTQDVAAVRREGDERRLVELRWGLVPSWANDAAIGNKLINARAETLSEKPSFRAALRARRCLVVADGFYEWAPGPRGKQPWYFRLASGRPFAFAGLWERWQGGDAEPLESCTIVTTTANDLVARVHDRMPVILDEAGSSRWLEGGSGEELAGLLRPFPAAAMGAHAVSLMVNSPANDSADCIAPFEPLPH